MRAGFRGLGLAAAALTVGCAAALHEPQPLDPQTAPLTATAVDRLLAEGDARFAERPDAYAVELAQRAFQEAARGDDTRVDGWLGLARVASWRVEHEKGAEARKTLVDKALDAAQWCQRRAPGRAECDYALAEALGQQARERPATAHDGLAKMVEALRRVIVVAPDLDEAGPHRVLALVLLRAPGWPAGPGDAAEGLVQAQKAVGLAPHQPLNELALSEALRRAGRESEAKAAGLRALALARARRGDPDASEWVDAAEAALRDLP